MAERVPPHGLPAIAKVLAQYRSTRGHITEEMIEAAWAEHAAVVAYQRKVSDALKPENLPPARRVRP